MKKIFIIAGEASGDLHASNLVKYINLLSNNSIKFSGIGGDKMKANGVELIEHISNTQFMGFVQVAKNLHKIRRLFNIVKTYLKQWKPDAIILVDYPGFNLRIAKFAKKLGIKVFYYISPQVWAWKENRVNTIREYVDKLFVVLPFEKEFYRKHNIDVEFVGHPLLDVIGENSYDKLVNEPYVLILPGSRKQEIKHILPTMLKATEKLKDRFTVVLGASASLPKDFYKQFLKDYDFVKVFYDKTYDLLNFAEYSINTSGTVTLETALFKVPQIICYKGNFISFMIAKQIVNIDFIGLPNLISGKQIVPELIQKDFNVKNILQSFEEIQKNRNKIIQDYEELYHKLGGKGASERTAKKILQLL